MSSQAHRCAAPVARPGPPVATARRATTSGSPVAARLPVQRQLVAVLLTVRCGWAGAGEVSRPRWHPFRLASPHHDEVEKLSPTTASWRGRLGRRPRRCRDRVCRRPTQHHRGQRVQERISGRRFRDDARHQACRGIRPAASRLTSPMTPRISGAPIIWPSAGGDWRPQRQGSQRPAHRA